MREFRTRVLAALLLRRTGALHEAAAAPALHPRREDLAPYAVSGITRPMLDATQSALGVHRQYPLLRFAFRNGTLFVGGAPKLLDAVDPWHGKELVAYALVLADVARWAPPAVDMEARAEAPHSFAPDHDAPLGAPAGGEPSRAPPYAQRPHAPRRHSFCCPWRTAPAPPCAGRGCRMRRRTGRCL